MAVRGFVRHFQRQFPSLPGKRVLVALSGGADSVALLHLLRDPALKLELEAVHVHHGVRAEEADADAGFCGTLCRDLEVRFHLRHIVGFGGRGHGREAWWRHERYLLLHQVAEQQRVAAVATGHHRDDVAEGVLMQLLRGTGPRGLAGIATEAPDGLIRPLLLYRHVELVQWLQQNNLSWREDSSNLDPGHLRNLVRSSLLPLLVQHSPGLRDHLVNLAGALAADEEFLAHQLEDRAAWIDPWHPDGGVPVSAVRDLPVALRRRWLQAQTHRCGLGRVSRRQLELLDGLLDDGTPRGLALGGRWCLRLASGQLWLEPPKLPRGYCFELARSRDQQLPIPGWWVVTTPAGERPAGGPWQWRPPDGQVITIRTARPGDVVRQRGVLRPVTRLTSKRLPRHLRAVWPLFCIGDSIEWIPGVWQDAATGNTGQWLVEVAFR